MIKVITKNVSPLFLPNTDWFQQVEDYVRSCSTSTKYWQHSSSWRLCQMLFYLLFLLFWDVLWKINDLLAPMSLFFHEFQQNSQFLRKVEDYVRGCSTSTKYWQLSTSWRLCQRLFYFYEILTAFNKLKIMSEVVLLLRNHEYTQIYIKMSSFKSLIYIYK
jgi:hypothetical protein